MATAAGKSVQRCCGKKRANGTSPRRLVTYGVISSGLAAPSRMISSKRGAAETTEYICQPNRAGRGDHASWASGTRICAARNTTKKQTAMMIDGDVRRRFNIITLLSLANL